MHISLTLCAMSVGAALIGSAQAADYQATVLEDNPVGYWRLGESTGPDVANLGSLGATANGTATDTIAFGLPGAIQGDANTAAGFDGSSTMVEVPYAEELNPAAFTFEVWANVTPDSSGVHRSPLAARDDTPSGNTSGVIFYADPSDNWQFWNGRGTLSWHNLGGAVVLPGEWTHLVGTYDGTNKAFYVNGVLVGAAQTGIQLNQARGLRIGASANENPAGQFFFNGSVDEAAVYGTALPASRILAHYKAGAGSDPAPVTPAIVAEPSSMDVFKGATASLSVLATGSLPLSYQWKFNGVDVPAATDHSLKLTNVQPTSSGLYTVAVSNPAGEVISAEATLTVADTSIPVITQQPKSRTVPSGASATFEVQASGSASFEYQWQFNGANIVNATNASLVLPNVQTANVGSYTVTVSNSAGSVVSEQALLQLLAAPTKSYSEIVTADGPVAYWRLNETSEEVADDAIGLNDGFYLNAVTLGLPGALLDTNGVALPNTAAGFQSSAQQKVDVAFTPDLNTDVFTVELWAKVTGGSGAYRSPLTSRGDGPPRGYIFYAEPGNTWQFWTGGGDAAGWDTLAGPGVVTDEWVYLAGTFDGTTKRFYVDGAEVASSTPPFGPNTENPLRIGAGKSETEGDYFFEGSVDEVAFYSKVLTPEQIALHYAAGRPTPTPQGSPISVQRSNDQVVVSWTTGALQEATDLTGPWQDVAGSTSPLTVTPSGTRKFYKLK